MTDAKDAARERAREIAAEYAERGDSIGWFEALYKEAAGNTDVVPWADLEPNKFFKAWADKNGLIGNGKKALVVGCGLGDDAKYLHDVGFKVTAFDISPSAIEWAKTAVRRSRYPVRSCRPFPAIPWVVRCVRLCA
jgi:2-polyprenyl-3-methyl-5-hydroxy-6-metoxy-1,4-benzoquinol methylase